MSDETPELDDKQDDDALDIDFDLDAGAVTTIDRAADIMERFYDAVDVDAVFGEPVRHGDMLVIPAAEVASGSGFAFGGGGGVDENGEMGDGAGGGGGGSTMSRPVAVIVVTPDKVHVEPIVDPTKVAVTFLTVLGMIFTVGARMRAMSKLK